ncbi:hypothetical protein IU433_28070 [Nocardia puris]|uniref:DUF8020 domain-containing protein n=1 Tax=Nocardia puris TaxID=208602 RepID=A0A366E4M3_9NOCA|nr:hypothetical protein [Nocardia puris]MBF6214368.1 hypothetical protein [Nocardia puris]MBF6368983.1 hypothetical protein [Nocardia puris]MBF6462869.1 hypothetical protein [Nocardia puris]RBO96749.1 hypothetical protein DFR74_101765 [Nocardia puris]
MRLATLTAAALGAAVIACSTTVPAAAHPAPPPAPAIGFTARVEGDSVVVESADTVFHTADGQLRAGRPGANALDLLPLEYRFGDRSYPIAATAEGNRATLTPTRPEPGAVATQIAGPGDLLAKLPRVIGIIAPQLTFGTAVGSLIGTVIGGSLGCLLGAAVPLTWPLLPLGGPIAGCVAGMVVGAAAGVVAGTILVGGPNLVIQAIQFFHLMAQPDRPAGEGR